jgi:hypothetical protein
MSERIDKEEEEVNSQKGVAEKKEAIQGIILQLEKVEEALLKKGAKTFLELYPKLEVLPEPRFNINTDDSPEDFNDYIGFRGIGGPSSDRRDAYIEL